MSEQTSFQRIGAISNAHVGRDFEAAIRDVFARQGYSLTSNFSAPVGHGERIKGHNFDLGSSDPPILVECKSHRWTAGNNVPSAKITVWNEAMYYFQLAPRRFRKCLCVLLDRRNGHGETLTTYYLRNYGHLVPDDVEVWEFDESTASATKVN
ncbi:MAG: hypothetical protein KDK07_12785 [Bauldia sp.]|nr:hypothetical protein [Bauldia sp.]